MGFRVLHTIIYQNSGLNPNMQQYSADIIMQFHSWNSSCIIIISLIKYQTIHFIMHLIIDSQHIYHHADTYKVIIQIKQYFIDQPSVELFDGAIVHVCHHQNLSAEALIPSCNTRIPNRPHTGIIYLKSLDSVLVV